MRTIRILPAEVDDLPPLASIQRAAFAPTAISRFIFGRVSPESDARHSIQRLSKALDDPGKAVYKAVQSVDGEAAAIVGLALWELPRQEGLPEEQEKPKKRKWPEGTDVEVAESFFSLMDFRPKERNYHLSILAVDPQRQRTGAGKALLQWGCRQADKQGVPVDLKATDLGMPLYLRCGFREFRDSIRGGVNGEIELFPMTRPALSLVPCTLADIPSLPQIYRLAFRPTAINQYCFPNVTSEAYDRWITARFTVALERRDEEGVKEEVMLAKRGDEVVGYAWYSFCPDLEQRGRSTTPRTFPVGADQPRTSKFMAKFDEHKETIKEAHWSFDNLAILPDAQGQGLGRALSLKLLERAREDGVKVTLESTELGLPLYEKLGYKRFKTPLVADDLPDVEQLWPMVYEHELA
ncbi:hypothetical protein JCM11641_006741 [Rhodosporidiobolus odoratus]